ncbi:MAG: lipid-binding SYLF domain-containing protein [Planctomycetota bacterium]|jgi:lipid-binding SYLF domain-containing protein
MKVTAWLGLAGAALALAACGSTQPETDSDKDAFARETEAAIVRLKGADAGLRRWFEDAYGYVVFPGVGKGGLIVGGAHGRGQVYEQGRHVGYASLKQGTIGLQAGGQSYIEAIFFKDQSALKAFQEGNWEMGAQVSAVAVKAGASADADYTKGVAVFTLAHGGLMAEASVAGQKFDYVPK